MYLHIVPKLFHLMANKCRLLSVSIPELHFKIEDVALSTGRPWPNKNIWVGMKKNRKAMNGILLKTNLKLQNFTSEFKWDIENLGVITHRVTSYIEDEEFDLVSQDIMLNLAFDGWDHRIHSAYGNLAPVKIQPLMESFITKPKAEAQDVWTKYEWGNFLNSREESLLLRTIEPERLNARMPFSDRYPALDTSIDLTLIPPSLGANK